MTIEDGICSFQLNEWTFRIDISNKEIKTAVLFPEMDYGLNNASYMFDC